MKTRIIAGAVLVIVLLVLVLAVPKWLTAVVFGLLLAIASYELLYRTGLVRHIRLNCYSAVMAFATSVWSILGAPHAFAVLVITLFFCALFAEMMADHIKVHFDMLAMCVVAGLIVPYLLSALMRILAMRYGRYLVLVPFIIAYANDAGAYFAGMKFGKHKLAPVVSPNKTIEGLLGGFGAALVGMLLYCLVLQFAFDFSVNYGYAILYAIVGAVLGAFGDLCFSIIKRQTGIKDYGNLIPGHGGVLDRFDSVTTVAPIMEAFMLLLPLVV